MKTCEAIRVPEVVGWGQAGAPWASADAWSLSRALAEALKGVGLDRAFGVLGGGIAPFSAGLAATGMPFHHFRHEAGAGFAAIEHGFETRSPGMLVVTTGPGLVNALNPVQAARVDGARLLVVSGFTSRTQVGRGAVQETSLASMPADVVRPGSLFHDVCIPEGPEEIPAFLQRLARGFQGPGGWVAHLGLPLSLQTRMVDGPFAVPAAWRIDPPHPSPEAVIDCLAGLLDPSALLWIGHGARDASSALREFAEAAHLPVVTSPRAKGVFPEDHPLFVGVSGAGGSPAVRDWFARRPPRRVLVIGTRLGEVTSFLAPGHAPTEGWLHVDIDPAAFGAAFPGLPGRGILADARALLTAAHARAAAAGWFETRRRNARGVETEIAAARRPVEAERARADVVRPSFLVQRIQRRVVEESDALVMSEAGTSFTWCNAGLRFGTPGRYRTSAAWGSMGHFTTGCIGAALAGRRKVVAVVGDGAMLMNNEINFAFNAATAWLVPFYSSLLGIGEERSIDTHTTFANTGPVLVPTSLFYGAHAGRIPEGGRVLMFGIGNAANAVALVFSWTGVGLAPVQVPLQPGL